MPELRGLDAKAIHEPYKEDSAAAAALDYPKPIADHAAARDRAIKAFKAIG